MDQFLGTHNILKLTQVKTDDLNRPISIKGIESIVDSLPKQQQAQMGSLANSKTHSREVYQVLAISFRG